MKILYPLRYTPCFSSPCLETYNQVLHSTLSEVLNIIVDSDLVWSQHTLPGAYSVIVVCSAVQLVAFAFLASAAGSLDLITRIFLVRLQGTHYPDVDNAIAERNHDQPPPSHPLNMRQKAWDIPCVQRTYDTLLDNAPDTRSCARLLAVDTKKFWLLVDLFLPSACEWTTMLSRLRLVSISVFHFAYRTDTSTAGVKLTSLPLMVSAVSKA